MMKDPNLEEKRKPRTHTILLESRQKVSVTGVTDVASFHEQEVILATDEGEITLVGEGLHIAQLNLEDGRLIVEGQISGLEYGDSPQARKAGVLGRLFR